MANEFYTLIVVPHAKARFRKFQVSVRLTRWVLAAFGGLTLVLLGILTHYTWIAVEVAELRRLRGENLALATKARAYEENAGQLQAKVLHATYPPGYKPKRPTTVMPPRHNANPTPRLQIDMTVGQNSAPSSVFRTASVNIVSVVPLNSSRFRSSRTRLLEVRTPTMPSLNAAVAWLLALR